MIKVLQKADILLKLIAENNPIGFTELQRHCEINKATLSLILKSMTELGWLHRDDGGQFFIGKNIKTLTESNQLNIHTKQLLRNAAEELSGKIGELVTVAVFLEGKRKVIAKFEVDHLVRVNEDVSSSPGSIFSTATGLVLLANMDEDPLKMYIQRHGLEERYKKFKDILSEVRKTGICDLSMGNNEARAIATGIYSSSGKIVAAIGFATPNYRLDSTKKQMAINKLKQCAEELNKAIS